MASLTFGIPGKLPGIWGQLATSAGQLGTILAGKTALAASGPLRVFALPGLLPGTFRESSGTLRGF